MPETYTDESLMPFGMHKDKPLVDVPASYLIWLYENNKCNQPLKLYIEENMDVLQIEVKRQRK